MFRFKDSGRWRLHLIVLATLAVAFELEATPPKSTGPGTAVSEQESQEDDRPSRRGVTPSAWLDALSRQSVTLEQQDAMTPMVRDFLHRTAAWSRDVEPRYREMLKAYRTADSEARPAMLVEIRALRVQRPQFKPLKDRLWNMLDNTQQVRLAKTIRERPPASGLTRRAGQKAARPQPGLEVDRVVQSPERDAGPEETDKRPGLWHFDCDVDPERHLDPSKEASKAGDEADDTSPESGPKSPSGLD